MGVDPNTLLGQEVGGYRLERLLGAGGAGTVYLGRGPDGQPVAVKVLAPSSRSVHLTAEQLATFQRRFLREAQVLERLSHPHILPLLAAGEDEASGQVYLVTPYLPGGTLATRLRGGPLPLPEVVRLIGQVGEALDYAHAQGVVHRDIKPSNVLLDERGEAVLADFGIAKLVEGAATQITMTSQVVGTPEYMAPEQVRNQAVSPATDVFGVGALAYQLVTGQPPFGGETLAEIVQRVLFEAPTPVRELRLEVPPPAEAVILQALAKEPGQRFGSVGAMAAALAEGMTGTWSAGVAVPPPNPPTQVAQMPLTLTPVALTPPALTPPGVGAVASRGRGVAGRWWLVAGSILVLLAAVGSGVLVRAGILGGSHTSSQQRGHGTPTVTATTQPGSITEFPVPLNPIGNGLVGIAGGPDGNVWFTQQAANQIGRITPSGDIKEFSVPTGQSGPGGITTGPDGNLWFTEGNGNQIGQITPSGKITEFPIRTPQSQPIAITTGPDNTLWFTETAGDKIGQITPSGKITEFPIPTSKSDPEGITSGPDNNLWFTEQAGNKIGRITPTGKITEFPIHTPNSEPVGITRGPDNTLWFTEQFGNRIGRITPSGKITEFPIHTPGSLPVAITTGPDKNLWFAEDDGNQIGRITPSGKFTEFRIHTPGAGPAGITSGPDGNVWFTEPGDNSIGRITP
jgi:streptogramin lyase